MKKLSLIALIVAILLPANSLAQKSTNNLSLDDAGKIVEMVNLVIDIYNEQLSVTRGLDERLEYYAKSIVAVSENPHASVLGSCGPVRQLRKDYVTKMKTAAAAAPAFAEKATILKDIDEVNELFVVANVDCVNLHDYFKDKKITEDDEEYSNFAQLYDAYGTTLSKIHALFDNVIELTNKAGDRAELVIIKEHPQAPVLIPMKQSLIALSQLMENCYNAETKNATMLTTEISSLRKSMNKNKVADASVKASLAQITNGNSYFERFYNDLEEALNHAESFVEYLNPEKEITNIDHALKETEEEARLRNLGSYYAKMREMHTRMVDTYNSI